MIFILLFAGQETTAALLTYILWKLGSNPSLQESLYQELTKASVLENQKDRLAAVNRIFIESIREFTPAYSVGRQFNKDVCLDYKLEGEDFMRKRVFYKDDLIGVSVYKYAKQISEEDHGAVSAGFVFESGKTICPDMDLAMAEITQFIAHLVTNYTFSTNNKFPLTKAMVTLAFAEPINLTLTERPKSI